MILGVFLSPGVKDVTSVLLPSKEKAAAGEEKFESLPAVPGMTRRDSQSTVHSRDGCTLDTKHRFSHALYTYADYKSPGVLDHIDMCP